MKKKKNKTKTLVIILILLIIVAAILLYVKILGNSGEQTQNNVLTALLNEEPEEEIKKSFLTIEKMEVCFNSYCISENSIDFDTLGYNDEISQYFTIDYKKLTDWSSK